jgi:elongator complex protein 2
MLESVLIGHEDWVHSVAWQPLVAAASGRPQPRPCLLSASMDRTMMLWRPDAATGLLVCTPIVSHH